MHVYLDHTENLEAILASELESSPKISTRPGEDHYDAGYRVVNKLADDISLDCSILDLEELG